MTAEEKIIKNREVQKRYYDRNKEKKNNAVGLKCPCSRPAVGRLDGVPICEFCKKIEEGFNHFTRSFVLK